MQQRPWIYCTESQKAIVRQRWSAMGIRSLMISSLKYCQFLRQIKYLRCVEHRIIEKIDLIRFSRNHAVYGEDL